MEGFVGRFNGTLFAMKTPVIRIPISSVEITGFSPTKAMR